MNIISNWMSGVFTYYISVVLFYFQLVQPFSPPFLHKSYIHSFRTGRKSSTETHLGRQLSPL